VGLWRIMSTVPLVNKYYKQKSFQWHVQSNKRNVFPQRYKNSEKAFETGKNEIISGDMNPSASRRLRPIWSFMRTGTHMKLGGSGQQLAYGVRSGGGVNVKIHILIKKIYWDKVFESNL